MDPFVNMAEIVAGLPREVGFWFSHGVERTKAENLRTYVERAWPTWPLGERSGGTSGLRMLPGQPRHAWPLVYGQRACGETLGSAGRYAIPQLYYQRVVRLNKTLEDVQKRRAEWPARRELLASLHEALGGGAAELDAYEALLFSDQVPLPSESSQEGRDADNIHLRVLDPAPEHLRFRNFFHARIQPGSERIPVPDGLGVWENAAYCLAYVKEHRSWGDHVCPPGATGFAWRLLHAAPQFDLDFDEDHQTHSGSTSGMSNHRSVARAWVAVARDATDEERAGWADDPLMQHVLPALQAGEAEWYLRYMDAAAAFDGLEQPELSWNALCAGALWVARKGGPWRPFFDAALALATRREWTDVRLALENQAARAELE